jgi:hypothetical protein
LPLQTGHFMDNRLLLSCKRNCNLITGYSEIRNIFWKTNSKRRFLHRQNDQGLSFFQRFLCQFSRL